MTESMGRALPRESTERLTLTGRGGRFASALALFGTPPDPSGLAGYAPLKTGTSGGRTGGFPRSAADDKTESHVACGVRDDQGAQGVEVVVHFVRDGNARPTVSDVAVATQLIVAARDARCSSRTCTELAFAPRH